MATTTNYGWETPDDTDLFKDGALAMRDLGQDVDTSLYAITYGKNVGLSFINETTFTGVSSVSLPTNTFTSVFENYRLLINLSSSAGSGNLNLRLRKAGTDNTSTNFIFGGLAVDSLGTYAAQVGNGSNALSLIRVTNDADNRFSVSLDLFNPKENIRTAFSGTGSGNAAAPEMHARGGFHNLNDTFDAATIFHSAGSNIAGKIQVYGYGN